MKSMLLPSALMFWLALLVSTGYSQNKRHPTRQEKQVFVYVLSGQDVRLYQVQRNGTLKAVYHDYVRLGQFPRCLAATPNGHTLYVASDADTNDYHSGFIFEFTIKKNGLLTRLGGIEAGSSPFPITVDSLGSFLYCISAEGVKQQEVIRQYRIGTDGTLFALKPPFVNLGKSFAQSLVVTPSRNYLYAPTKGSPLGFHISRNGTLSQLSVPPTQSHIKEIALGPSGKYAYFLQSSGLISVAAINQRTGVFSPLRPMAHVPTASYNLSTNPQSSTLQITNAHITGHNVMTSGPISEFRIMPSGDLKPSVPPTFSAFMAYGRLAPDLRAGFVKVTR